MMKYAHGFFGAIFGTLISYLLLIIILPICVPIYFFIKIGKEFVSEIRKKPLMLINPLTYLGIALLIDMVLVYAAIFTVFSPIALAPSIGKNTAIACYNHGWKGWLSPFKYIKLVFSERYDNEHIKNISGFSHDEKAKIAETTIATYAIKTNQIIKQNIDANLRKRSTEGDKSIPIEISAIITAYSMEEYKKNYDNGNIVVEPQEVANIAEKNLKKHIHQSHTPSWNVRIFSCFRISCYFPRKNNISVSSNLNFSPKKFS